MDAAAAVGERGDVDHADVVVWQVFLEEFADKGVFKNTKNYALNRPAHFSVAPG